MRSSPPSPRPSCGARRAGRRQATTEAAHDHLTALTPASPTTPLPGHDPAVHPLQHAGHQVRLSPHDTASRPPVRVGAGRRGWCGQAHTVTTSGRFHRGWQGPPVVLFRTVTCARVPMSQTARESRSGCRAAPPVGVIGPEVVVTSARLFAGRGVLHGVRVPRRCSWDECAGLDARCADIDRSAGGKAERRHGRRPGVIGARALLRVEFPERRPTGNKHTPHGTASDRGPFARATGSRPTAG